MTKVAMTKVAQIIIAAAAFMISGCFILPFGTVGELNGVEYLKVETITAWSCDESLFGINTTDQNDVVAKIKEKAQSAGANGITNLACEKGPPGCTGSMKCTATAVKVASRSPQTK